MDTESGSSAPIATIEAAADPPARDAAHATRGFREIDDSGLRGFRAPQVPRSSAAPPDIARPTGQAAPRRRREWTWAAVVAGVLVVALAVIAVLAFRLGSRSTTATTSTPATTTTPTTTANTLPVSGVYRQILPSMVLVTTSTGKLGTGVIVTDTGTILTAAHVVSGGGTVSVQFSDGTKAAATISATDAKTDIAALSPQGLPEVVVAATLGGTVAVGADIVAVGNPLALQDSTSHGVVSGLGRTGKTAAGPVSGLIQFDAAVNPGSSGGPLLDNQGSVVGIVVAIADPGNDDAFAGIGFAVPIGAAVGGATGQGPGGGPQK